MSEATVARFWAKVEKSDGCWLWTACKQTSGYGWLRDGASMVLAHRFSWVLANGPIPSGMWVLHRCDVRACVCPSHLFLGTHADNMADMVIKGRGPARFGGGETHSRAKLTAAQVREIRALCGTQTQREIAAIYGVTPQQVSQIKTGKNWASLPA